MSEQQTNKTNNSITQQLPSAAKLQISNSGTKTEDVESFIQEICDLCSFSQYDDTLSKYILSLLLKAEAKQWYSTIPHTDSFTNILRVLKTRFQPADKLAQALTYKSDTQYDKAKSLQSYLDTLKLTAMRGGVGEETTLAMIYKNVPDEVKSNISVMRQNQQVTWDTIYYIAKCLMRCQKHLITTSMHAQ